MCRIENRVHIHASSMSFLLWPLCVLLHSTAYAEGGKRSSVQRRDPVCEYAYRAAQQCSTATTENTPCPVERIRKQAWEQFIPRYDLSATEKQTAQLSSTIVNACHMGCGSSRARVRLPSRDAVCVQLGLSKPDPHFLSSTHRKSATGRRTATTLNEGKPSRQR